MYNRNRPMAFSKRNLFPPVVPNNIPAFVGNEEYKIFFKKSVANFAGIINNQKDFDKFNQAHIAINSLETNRNAIDTNKYKTGYICIPLAKESLDTPLVETKPNNVYRVYEKDVKTPYCIILNGRGDSFAEVDKLYKVQIRLGNWTDDKGDIKIPKDQTELRLMERDDSTTSEWSSVIMMKPISAPSFGVYKFYTDEEFILNDPDIGPELRYNKIGTANFDYVGFYSTIYDMVDEKGSITSAAGNERIVEYRFKMYDGAGKKVLSDSGPINMIEHERRNISHTFNYLTQDQERYFIDFSIKTENGYEAVKRYSIKAEYIVLEMSNAMVRVTEERPYARMKLQIQAKQVVLEPILKPGTEEISKLEFVKDIEDPLYSELSEADKEKIKSTHVMVEGVAQASKSFYLSCPKDIWIMEAKIAGLTSFDTREEALNKPYILVENEHLAEQNIPYLTQVSLISYKKTIKGLGVGLDEVTNPDTGIKSLVRVNNDKVVYIIEGVKSSYKRVRGKNVLIAEQTVKIENAKKIEYTYDEIVEIGGELQKTEVTTKIKRELKDIVALDFVYPMSEDGSRQLTPLESDPEIVETSRKGFVTNEPNPINPCQEYYLFLTNYMGGFGLEVIENKKYKSNPSNPLEILEEDYIIKNPVLKQFLETKIIPSNE